MATPKLKPAKPVDRVAESERNMKEIAKLIKAIAAQLGVLPVAALPPSLTTPEDTLREAGISDKRQAKYQRRMSSLLAGEGVPAARGRVMPTRKTWTDYEVAALLNTQLIALQGPCVADGPQPSPDMAILLVRFVVHICCAERVRGPHRRTLKRLVREFEKADRSRSEHRRNDCLGPALVQHVGGDQRI